MSPWSAGVGQSDVLWALGRAAASMRASPCTSGNAGAAIESMFQDLPLRVPDAVEEPHLHDHGNVVLALGIGANTTIYMRRAGHGPETAAVREPERLMFIGELSPAGRREAVAPANFVDRSAEPRVRADGPAPRRPLHPDGPSGPRVGHRSERLEHVLLRAPRAAASRPRFPAAGRTARRRPGGHPQPRMLGAALLTRSGIVGRSITLDGLDHTVVGVLPPDFSLWDTDVWVAGFDPTLMIAGSLTTWARSGGSRRAYRSIRRGRNWTRSAVGWRWRIPPRMRAGRSALPLQEAWLGAYRQTSLILLAAVAMVLFIACGNLANLLLERALARDREVSIRLALGARRRRIARQMFTESLLLALLGGAAGVLAASWSLRFVVTLIPANTLTQIPGGAASIHLDLHTLGVVLIISLAAGVLFGFAPAVRMARADVRALCAKPRAARRPGGRVTLASHARGRASGAHGDSAHRGDPDDSKLLAVAGTGPRPRPTTR